nr:hypothetical protein [Tanacetum cinerariifolium]
SMMKSDELFDPQGVEWLPTLQEKVSLESRSQLSFELGKKLRKKEKGLLAISFSSRDRGKRKRSETRHGTYDHNGGWGWMLKKSNDVEGSNTMLKNHITHPHCEVIKVQKNQNPKAGQTFMARDGSVFRYDSDYLREQFASLVIQRALPFNHSDHEQTTRVFQNTMQPRYTHVSRSTLKRDAMRLWLVAKQEINDSFGNLNACVNLTTDVWSAPHGVPGSYMCVTPHWIETGTWEMTKRVISFEEFPSPHTGRALFKMLIKLLTKFNLKDKVMSITLDNASNNTSVMDKLKLKYDPPMGIFFMSTVLSECELEGGILSSMIKPMKKKLRKYFQHMPPIITCAAALNPWFNVNGEDFLIESISSDLEFFDDGFVSKSKSYFRQSFEGFWKEKETMFPVLSRMAMDLISVQASSVASESAFSTSERVLSI